METVPTLDGLLSGLGIQPQDPAPAGDPPAGDPPPAEPPNTDPAPAPGGNEPPPAEPQQPQIDQKTKEAFAQMRIQNKKYASTIKGVAGILGVDENTPEEKLLEALQQKIVADKAQKQNVPEELYKRLMTLESNEEQRQALLREQQAALGFQALQTKFGLDQNQLNAFAQELVAAGKNPFQMEVDMIREYRDMHYDDLMQQAIEKALSDERERAAKASTQATTPGTQQGGKGDPAPDKVNSVRDLNNWFNSQMKS